MFDYDVQPARFEPVCEVCGIFAEHMKLETEQYFCAYHAEKHFDENYDPEEVEFNDIYTELL